MSDYRFVTSIFGEKHLGMLLVNLFSIYKNIKDPKVSVFWQEISEEKKNSFKKAFSFVDFYDTNFDLSSSKIKRISSKTVLWDYAAKILPPDNLCFFDADMLVLKDIGHFFDKNFDLLFTDKKKEIFPLNTGVILTKGLVGRLFMSKWLEETFTIIEDESLLETATSTKYPYGGADQMSFYKIVNYSKEKDIFQVNIDNQELKFVSAPCSYLNETRSIPLNNEMHIIHYKGGWQMMFLHGKGFNKNRTRENSWEMYILYLKTYYEAIKFINYSTGANYDYRSFIINIPFYLNKKTLKENKFLYCVFFIIKKIEDIFDSILYKIKLNK